MIYSHVLKFKINIKINEEEMLNENKGAGGMKLASDFVLPFSCFSSNHLNLFPIRVEMCYSGSPMKENI